MVPSRAPKGVWFEAPRSTDPKFPVIEGRDGAAAQYILELTGSGVGLIDYDKDGDLDLYVVMGRVPGDPADPTSDRLLRNNFIGSIGPDGKGDSTFTDVTDAAGLHESGYGMGVAVGDFDHDGFDDLFVTHWGADRLLRNRGDGTFEDVTAAVGMASTDGAAHWSTSAAFGDADGDGDLDLYVCRYYTHDAARPPNDGKPCPFLDLSVPCGPQWLPAERDLFWRNDGGHFTECSKAVGMQAVRPSYGLGCTWFDVDGDGKLDLFVGNDSLPNFVFRNVGSVGAAGSLRFEEVGAASGLSANQDGKEQACMGVDVGDFDGDGRDDLFVTNFSADYNTLYRNDGGGFFTDATKDAQIADASWWTLGWATRFFDADCDGDLDLYVANGHIYPTIDGRSSMTYAEQDHLWQNQGGRFDLISKEAGPGLALVEPSRGAAFGDLDGDGWIDVVVIERNRPLAILRAVPQAGVHRLLVELVPGPDQRPVDHAMVTVRAGGKTQVRRMNRGGSFCSSSDPRVHFGLGASTRIDELIVRWPDGAEQRFHDLAADQRVRVRRGEPELRTEALR